MAHRHVLRTLPRLAATGVQILRIQTPKLVTVNRCLQSHIPVRSLTCRQLSTAAPNFECINIQDSTDFQRQVLENTTPVVVDFHATWCGPCKLLGPRLESIIGSKSGKVVLAKVDVDDNPELAMKYGVRSVPTVLAVKKGEVLDQFIGCREDDEIDTFVEELIN